MTTALALIPVDLKRSSLGLPRDLSCTIHGSILLAHTLKRTARIENLSGIVLLHPEDQDPSPLLAGLTLPLPVHLFPVSLDRTDGGLSDKLKPMRIAARKPAVASWRGGLGGMTIYDELLAAAPMAEALTAHNADAGVLIGADWVLVDPAITSDVLKIHLDYPDAMQLTFSQAAPGLAGVAISKELLQNFATNDACIGQVISYNPQRPQADPIGRDVCAQIPPQVRDCPHRVVYELPRDTALIQQLADHWQPQQFTEASAVDVVAGLQAMGASTAQTSDTGHTDTTSAPTFLPREVTLELTPKRTTLGPILPQFHVKLNRPNLNLADAKKLFTQLGKDKDSFVVLGGLGDALLHPQWEDFVLAAHEAGVLGVCVETDLLVDEAVLMRLLELPIDIISVRINADTQATYRKVMDSQADETTDHFKQCIENLQWLLNTRNARWQQENANTKTNASPGLPWIVPLMVKTPDTFGDMETFFDRWMVYTSAAVIAPAQTGGGLMPAMSPVHMAPPRRRACRQLANRMSILSDGSIALCDQDWLSKGSVGQLGKDDLLADVMSRLVRAKNLHVQGKWDELSPCSACDEWYRP